MIATCFGLWFWKNRQESWIPLSRDNLASVEVERAIYENDAGTKSFLRFRIANRSTRALCVDLRDRQNKWKPFHPFRWTMAEGDHRGCVDEMIEIPLLVNFKAHEQQTLRAMRIGKTENLTIVAPGKSIEYFAELPQNRARIESRYNHAPLWMKAKTFWPRAPFSLHLITMLRGALFYSDDARTESSTLWQREVAMRFLLKWKSMTKDACVIGKEK